MSASKSTIGYAVQLGGIGALVLGAVLSAHHAAIAAAFLGGAPQAYARLCWRFAAGFRGGGRTAQCAELDGLARQRLGRNARVVIG